MVSSITPTVLAVERYHAIFSEAFQNSITAERRQHKAVHRLHLDSKWIYIFPEKFTFSDWSKTISACVGS